MDSLRGVVEDVFVSSERMVSMSGASGVSDVRPGAGSLRRAVDLRAPLLPQVASLGDDYGSWVHRSVKVDRSLRIFRSGLLEAFTHIPWWLILAVWVPIVVALLYWSSHVHDLAGSSLGWRFAAGTLLWTMLEYSLHRFVFHYHPRSDRGRQFHFLAHGIHHLDPWDATRLVFPPLPAFLVAAAIFGVLRLAMPVPDACAVMSGLLTGYVAYDMTHYYVHHARPTTRWGKYLKRYHLEHHHRYPDRLFGVSTPLWDVLCGTGRPRPE